MIVNNLLLVAVSILAQAQPGNPVSGSYGIYVGGRSAGVEKFEQMASAQSVVLKSTTEFGSGGQTEKITTITEMRGARPVRYEVQVSGGQRFQRYSLQFNAGVATVVIEAHGRRSERAIEVSEDVVLLDKNVWHHYGLLISRYDLKRRGAQRFAALTPQAGLRQYDADVEYKDKIAFNTEGGRVSAHRFMVILGDGYEAEVIADESNRVLAIEVTALDTKVVLQL